MVKLLLEKGAAFDICNNEGDSPFDMTSNTEILLLFIERYPTILDKKKVDMQLLLYRACASGNTKVVDALLQRNVNVDELFPAFQPFLPMDWALAHGQFDVVRQMVEHFGESYEDFLEDQFLAHVFGIQGYSASKGFVTNYEGFNRLLASQKLSSLACAFLDENDLGISSQDREALKRALKAAPENISKNPEELAAEIKAGHAAILFAGWDIHITAAVFRDKQVGKANRGPGANPFGVEFLKMENHDSLHKMIADLQQKAATPEGRKLFTEGFGLKPDGQIEQSKQPAGNCGWASAKSAFFALLDLYFDRKVAHEIYKKWTGSVSSRALKEYKAKVKNPDLKLLKLVEKTTKYQKSLT